MTRDGRILSTAGTTPCTTSAVASASGTSVAPRASPRSRATSSRPIRSSRGCDSPGWAGAIDTSTQFTAFTGLAREGRVAYASGFTGLGVASTRFMAEPMLDLLAGRETERTALEMVRTRPLPFPPARASVGIGTRRAGRSTAPTTTAAGATCCCAPSTRSASGFDS